MCSDCEMMSAHVLEGPAAQIDDFGRQPAQIDDFVVE